MVGLKAQYEVARAYQEYESFFLVSQKALGGGKSSEPDNVVGSFDELQRAFMDIGGTVG